MKRLVQAACLVATAIIFSATQSRADVVIAWDVAGHGTPVETTFAASLTNANLTATGDQLSRVGITATVAANSYSSTTLNNGSFNQSNFYYTFTITPVNGQVMTLTDMAFNINGSNTGPNNGTWGYSINGGAFTLSPTFSIVCAGNNRGAWDFVDFDTTQSVEFRFWAWGLTSIGGAGANNQATLRLTNSGNNSITSGYDLLVNGTFAPVPEPSTIALIGFGMLGMLAFARRRHA